MPYVQRFADGAIQGLYNRPQPGYAEEFKPDDDPDVVAFRAFDPGKTIIYKADIWRRATDAEASIIDGALNSQPVRLRRLWQDSQTLATTDEMYPVVLQAFQEAFGVGRARTLLEPSA